MFQHGEIIDDTYQIVGEIGNGGTGIVFQAYHLRLKKYVVLKKIKYNYIGRVNVRLEVDILKKLHHRYLPQVYDFVQRGTEVYTVIDYIEGYDLEYYMENGYQIREEDIVKWLKQLCDVLDYLHKQNPPILHSDIKPGNIMITNEGNICLIDFNISLDEQTGNGISGLSQYYAAPEQVEKAIAVTNHLNSSDICLDARMDIYSLGATFYYILSGIRPNFRYQEIYPIGYMELPYSYGLRMILQKAMSYRKEERYQSAEEMRKALINLRKLDAKYRIWMILRFGSFVIYALLMSLGILLCVSGVNTNNMERYNSEFEVLHEMYYAGNNNEAITKGIQILNNKKYENIVKESPDETEICYIIGECYYYNENYEGAVEYYGLAYEKMGDKKEEKYFRDFAIALVKQGKENIPEAEEVLNCAKEWTGESTGIAIVKAQINQANKEYGASKEIAKEIILDESVNGENKFMAYIILAEVYEQENDLTNAIRAREQAYIYDEANKNNIRKLTGDYVEKINTYNDFENINVQKLCEKAEKYYELLINTVYPTLEDQINYAVICRLLDDEKKLDRAKKILLNLRENYSSDYRIDMNLAYIYKKSGDKIRANDYCSSALRKYNKNQDGNGNDYENLCVLKQELGE